jgi:hypothetical protein
MPDVTGGKYPEPHSCSKQPIVIFGGFLSFPSVYWSMRDTLLEITSQPVWIVDAHIHDWIWSVTRAGWAHLLRLLERAVRQAAQESPTGKVTLVGHSSGGVMGRLYLGDRPFLGHTYRGLDYVDHLITLGSPHHNRRGGRMRRWVDQQYPGPYFAPKVKYHSVAGKIIRGDKNGSFREWWSYYSYDRLIGDGHAWGDGLVPVASALLQGSRQTVLQGVGHFSGFGGPWYGTEEVIPRWWNAGSSGHDLPATEDHPW